MNEPLKMYGRLASWFHLLTSPVEYGEEARMLTVAFREFARRPVETLLELGSGGGNNASHLKSSFAMTLVDLSPAMLDLSRRINPELEHVEGDMRTIRLGRLFDGVLVHDAVGYMTTEDDLRAAIRTAADHLKPGGVAIFDPDAILERFAPTVSCGGHDDETRGMRWLMWEHPLKPGESSYEVTFVYATKEGDGPTQIEHEEHRIGVFPRATWLSLVEDAGLEAHAVDERKYGLETGAAREMILGVKPG